MVVPMHGEDMVVLVGGENRGLGPSRWRPDEQGLDAPSRKEEEAGAVYMIPSRLWSRGGIQLQTAVLAMG